MERAESCRGLISGHPNTASRMGKQRLKAGKGSDFRPLVAEDMACTAAAIAGCCGIGTKSCFPPESNTEVFVPARGNVIINKLSQFNPHFFQSYLHCKQELYSADYVEYLMVQLLCRVMSFPLKQQ